MAIIGLQTQGLNYGTLNIERTIENLNTSSTKDIVISRDFKCNMHNNNLPNRMQNLILSYDLCQQIDEPTHFTENFSSLIDLAIVNNPSNVLFGDVISPTVPNLVRFHCPILVTLKFRKSIQKTFKHEVCLYDRGNYNHYRQKLNDVNWDALFTSNDINEISDNIMKHILTAAKDTIPNKKVTN